MATTERLIKLIQECAEVTHAATKALEHGLEGFHPETLETNRAALEREIGDLALAIENLVDCGNISNLAVRDAIEKKRPELIRRNIMRDPNETP